MQLLDSQKYVEKYWGGSKPGEGYLKIICVPYHLFEYSDPAIASASLAAWLKKAQLNTRELSRKDGKVEWQTTNVGSELFGRWQADTGSSASGRLELCVANQIGGSVTGPKTAQISDERFQDVVDQPQPRPLRPWTLIVIFMLLVGFLNRFADTVRAVIGRAIQMFRKP